MGSNEVATAVGIAPTLSENIDFGGSYVLSLSLLVLLLFLLLWL